MESAVVTFDRHPAAVVRPESAPRLLTDLDQKLELLAATGHRPMPGDHLRRGPLQGAGRGVRAGGAGGLPRRQGRDRGGGLPLRPPAQGATSGCSRRWAPSSASRSSGLALVDADGDGGRRPAQGQLHGDPPRAGGGRPRHAPTACSAVPTRCGASWPTATSVAASWASPPPTCRCPATSSSPPTGSTPVGTSARTAPSHPTAISLGRRPTFYEEAHASLLEAHLLDFDDDLYGEAAKVRFVAAPARRGEVRRRRGARRADPS